MICDYILVNPPKLKFMQKKIDDACLGLGYINAVAKTENSGMILDAYLNDWSVSETVNKIINHKPTVVGISCNFYSSVPTTVEIVNELRHKGYKGHICLGGHGAFSCKENLLKFLDINSLCLGDGELAFKELLKKIKDGTFSNNVDGYYFKSDDVIIDKYAKVQLIDIEKLPYPTRIYEESYPVRDAKALLNKRGTHCISTTRGCTYNCSYCDISTFYNKKRRVRTVDSVIEEIKHLIDETGIKSFVFSDDNFIGGTKEGRARAIEFCNAIKRNNLDIEFIMEARVTDIFNDMLLPLIDAGLVHLNVGVESGCQRMLNTWKKGITVQQSEKAIEKLQSLGLSYNINFILYDMYTTLDELWQNYDFFVKTRIVEFAELYMTLFENHLGVFSGTPIAKKLEKEGLLKNYTLDYATEEEQRIFDKFHPIYRYELIDNNMRYFVENHNYWLRKIRKLIKDNEMDFYSYSTKAMRFLCLKCYKKSIENGEKKIVDTESLDKLIDKFKLIKNLA
ncbi:B12-binding domain-containing radical SAM protein [Abyssisolibacter fermentans]|uniref:B12-binding domain-containing radical SAM protein n=1 Tax=Abyssisolibacter fermentans TaxID=1766203 RepID=UPI00082F682C|nr:radical SAM protein [Abyssisolibacter fermentans]